MKKSISPQTAMNPLGHLIFASRWLQVPLYLGLIIAQMVYVGLFFEELWHLVEILWKDTGLVDTIKRMGLDTGGAANAASNLAQGLPAGFVKPPMKETVIMLIVLSLIDVVMISNLLVMVIVGGYETFVSRLNLDGHPDQPEWLSHVNANVLKVKLATAIIGISSIHLLKTFISAESLSEKALIWQTIIHIAFLASAVSIAWIDRIMAPTHAAKPKYEASAE
jgi:uncharacterized protein (TIGR00645 family)